MLHKLIPTLLFVLLVGGWLPAPVHAQISIGGQPYSFTQRVSKAAPNPVVMPAINLSKLQAEDRLEEQAGLAPRFGQPLEVNLNTSNSGEWETLPDGGRLWRLAIQAPGAKSINLLYNDFYLPDGGVLYIYSADRKHVIGGFTSANNKPDRIFATGLVYSDHIVLEYYESAAIIAKRAANSATDAAAIGINYVVHGYRFIEFDPKDLEKAFGSSGSCNVNTICSQGDNWRNEIKSVAMLLVGGSRFCTGFLVNNTAQDCRPLLLTANHCLGSADAINSPSVNTWTFMWRYESPNCTPNTDGPTNMTTNGGTVLANPGNPGDVFSSDFALIEMAENPKTAGYDVFFAGFDATTTAPSAATGIHHPRGDVKKISMENAALTGTSYLSSSGTATHWRVFDWDSGTTEPGSSGSPIFSNATKRAMGFLSGGGAACGNDLSDWYGSIAYSWNNGGASDSRRRLRDHLDPGGIATFVDGSGNPGCAAADPCAAPIETIACASPKTITLVGSGAGWNVTACGFSTPGAEKVYSFTPTITGIHTLQVPSVSGGYIDYFWKAASGGCSASGWTCIDDIGLSTSIANFGPLTAGVTYYILLDAEGTSSRTHTFQINCPAPPFDPCATPIETIACASPKTITLVGSGAGWNVTACGFSTPGAEKVYSFTHTITGIHTLQVPSVSGGYIDYFWKAASGGCSASGWTCIDDIGLSTSIANFGPLTAGVTYYILLDAEGTSSRTHTFQINCPPSCPTFSGAPANVGIVNSVCNSGTVSGGSITAPGGTPCPAGSTLQYNVNNTGWTTSLPTYNQTGPAQTIITRCACNNDANNVSAASTAVTTVPGVCSPDNDLCANATPISCGTTITGTNVNATAEPAAFSACGVAQTTAGVWYTFVGDGSTVTLSTCSAANFDTKISVYTGGCTTPACVAGNDDACPGNRSTVTFIAANGTAYLILIHGFAGATGTFDLTMTCAPTCPTFSGAPANVGIVNSVCNSGTVSGGSITAPGGTPCPAGSTLQYNVNNTGWTTSLPTYNQTGPAQTIITRCACNNDANNVSAASTAVTTVPGVCGPDNDLCINATPLVSNGGNICGTTINAGADNPNGGATCGTNADAEGAGVWYTFIGDGSVWTFNFPAAPGWDPEVNVYSGTCASLTCIGGDDDSGLGLSAQFTINTVVGTTYYAYVHPASDSGNGTSDFCFTVTSTPVCPTFSGSPANVGIVNSSCGSGCTLTGGSITAPGGTPCPAGSTLQYNVNNTGWTTSLPVYNQAGPAQTIRTRCACDNDANNVSAESSPVTTVPGTLSNPVVPANGAATVACLALATQPTPPVVTACDGSVITPTGPVIMNTPNPLACEGTSTYTWTYSCGTTSATWSFVYTIERTPFTVPANGAATVSCPALAIAPTALPVVTSACGETLSPAGPVVTNSPNPLTCEGTRTYAYTYTDCEGNTATWSFVYTIERAPFTVPANGAATVNSVAQATPPTLPTVTSACGETLTPAGPTVVNNPNPLVCAGTRTYTYTYTDCEGNTANWSFVYTIVDNEPPMATCFSQTVVFNGQSTIALDANGLVSATDNCGIASISLNPAVVTCAEVGATLAVIATVTDLSGNPITCVSNVTLGGLPCGWSQQPDGVNCEDGNSVSYNPINSQWTVTSTNCYYASPFSSDETAFAQRTLCGDGSITALVTSINGNGWAGVVMRESNAPGAKKAQLTTNLGNFSRREFRTLTNGQAFPQQFPSNQRYWLRIVRTGIQFDMFVSPNGVTWYPVGSQRIAMANCIEMGLTVTNFNANSTVTATFSNVSYTGGNGNLLVWPGAEANASAPYELQQLDASFRVFPNPTSGDLQVDLTHYLGRNVRIETYSLEGKILQISEIDEVQTAIEWINLANFQSGMYLIKVTSDGWPDATRRVVLTRR